MYQKGQGCEQNEEEADEWLRRSAAYGGRLGVNWMPIGGDNISYQFHYPFDAS
jgi:TPR repeat protein